MFAFALLALAATQAPAAPGAKSATPHFGAFLEQLDDRPNSGFAAYSPEGKLWTVPLSSYVGSSAAQALLAAQRGQCAVGGTSAGIAFTGNGKFYLADVVRDAVVVYPERDLVDDGLGALSSHAAFPDTVASRGPGLGEVRAPAGLAFDPRGGGRVLVADTLNHRVGVFSHSNALLYEGKPLTPMGAFGSGDGQLNHPNDVAVDALGFAYVADVGNDRIVKFDPDGKFVKSFGGRGSYPGLFAAPTGVDVHADRLYVADRDNHRIQVFDLDGTFVYEWGVHALLPREGHGKLHYPTDVAVSPAGDRVAVVEPMEDRVQIFGPATEDTVLTTTERDTASHYGGYCSVRGDVFAIAEPSGPSVSIFDLSRGTPIEITRFGRPGSSAGRMLRPTCVLLDAKGESVYVADPFAYRISEYRIARKPDEPLRFDPFLARFVRSVDIGNSALGRIEPEGMALGSNGEILVVDAAGERVVVFNAALEVVRAIGDGQLSQPRGIAFDPSTHETLVTSTGFLFPFGVVYAFAMDGSRSRALDYGNFPEYTHPFGVALSRSTSPWVSDRTSNRIRWRSFDSLHPDSKQSAPDVPCVSTANRVERGEFFKPEGIATDERGRIFVVDAGNHRFQILDASGKYLDMWGARFFTEAARTPPPPAPAAHAWDGARSVRTNDGSWRVLWRPKTDAIPRGTPFAIDVWVFAPGQPDFPATGMWLTVDAWMPEHLHGMTRVPTVMPRDDGGFTVDGLYFHMPGFWELGLDVVSGGVSARATVRIDLE